MYKLNYKVGDNIRICYLQRLDKFEKVRNKIFKYLFGIIMLKEIDEDIVIVFPNYTLGLTKMIYRKRIIKKIAEILYNNNISTLVLSNSLKDDDMLKNDLYNQNLSILDGKLLFEIMLQDCLEYVANKQNVAFKKLEVTILANDVSDYLLDNIMLLSDNIKNLNIVTNNLDKFKKIEDKISDKFGVIIRVSNNKRKSLAQSKIIVNMDFPEELLNKYKINEKAILVNLSNRVKIHSKKFSGININDYNLGFTNEIFEKYKKCGIENNFNKKELYESIVIKERNLYIARDRIRNDKVRIIGLIGNNGKIHEREYMNFV